MNRELLKFCRYFRGEKKCPEKLELSGLQLYWFYEKVWVEMNGDYDGFGDYERNRLEDFEKNDGVPLTLKRLLFNRYMHWCGYGPESIQGFKDWYNNNYK